MIYTYLYIKEPLKVKSSSPNDGNAVTSTIRQTMQTLLFCCVNNSSIFKTTLGNSKIFSTDYFHSIDWKSKKEKLESETKEPVKIDLIKEDGNFSSFSQAICILPTPFSWLSQGYYFIILASAPTKSIDLKAFRRTKNWNSIFLFDEVVHLIKLGTILPYPATYVVSVPKKPFLKIQWCIYVYVFWLTSVSSQRFTVGLTPLEYIVQLLWQRLLAASSCCSHHGAAFSLISSMIKLKAKLEYVSVINKRVLIRHLFSLTYQNSPLRP